MLSAEQIKERLKHRNLKEVERVTGMNYLTIYNLAKGLHRKPHKSTLKLMTIYFEENP